MGFWHVIGFGWRGAIGALRHNGFLLAATFLAMLVITALIQPALPHWHSATHGSPNLDQAKPFDIFNWLADFVRNLLYAIAAKPLMVAVHRSVLLSERGQTFTDRRRIMRFATWLVAYRLVPTLPSSVMDGVIPKYLPIAYLPIAGLFILALNVVSIYLDSALAMSFLAFAMDKAQPIRDSWDRVLGHWWYVAGVMFIGSLPPLILGVGSIFSGHLVILIVAASALNTLWPVLGAALASALYKRFGGLEARHPRGQQPCRFWLKAERGFFA